MLQGWDPTALRPPRVKPASVFKRRASEMGWGQTPTEGPEKEEPMVLYAH